MDWNRFMYRNSISSCYIALQMTVRSSSLRSGDPSVMTASSDLLDTSDIELYAPVCRTLNRSSMYREIL